MNRNTFNDDEMECKENQSTGILANYCCLSPGHSVHLQNIGSHSGHTHSGGFVGHDWHFSSSLKITTLGHTQLQGVHNGHRHSPSGFNSPTDSVIGHKVELHLSEHLSFPFVVGKMIAI